MWSVKLFQLESHRNIKKNFLAELKAKNPGCRFPGFFGFLLLKMKRFFLFFLYSYIKGSGPQLFNKKSSIV